MMGDGGGEQILGGWDDLYPRVERAIEFIVAQSPLQPSLEAVAKEMALSPTHAQRVFQRWAGISPKRLAKLLAWTTARERLRDGQSVLSAALEAELSGPGRLHDLSVSLEAMTPGESKRRGQGLEIVLGQAMTPLGLAVIGSTARGVCALRFVDGEHDAAALRGEIRAELPRASWMQDDGAAHEVAKAIFETSRREPTSLSVLVKGTNFQVQVWQALLQIPEGQVVSYKTVADLIGRPRSVRAVGQAIGANPVGWLIPCHRVLKSNAQLSGYRWGKTRKRAALLREAAAVKS